MKIREAIKKLEALNPDYELICQVVANDGTVFMLNLTIGPIAEHPAWLGGVVISAKHPNLETLRCKDERD